MSLLSDLLSKIRLPLPGKEVPPGLRSTVFAIKKKELNKRRLVVIMALFFITVISGFVLVYLIEVYLKGGLKQSAMQNGIAVRQVGQQGISSPSRSNENLSENRGQTIDNGQITDSRREVRERSNRSSRSHGRWSPHPIERQEKQEIAFEIPKEEHPVQQEGQKVATTEKIPDTSEKDINLYMASNYEARGDYSNAISSYKKVLSIEPRNYRVMNNIASIFIKLNSNEEAKSYLQMALNIRNDYVPGLINMGIVLARLGETRNAEDKLLQAITLEPNNREALLNLAILYEREGNYERAHHYYLRLKQLGDPRGESGLERINIAK